EQYSYGADTVRDGVSFSKQEDDKTLVSYSDIQKLPDLECYVTLPGDYPVVRMKMTYEKIRPVAAEFTERALNDSLEQDISVRLDAVEQDDPRLQRLLDGSGTPAPETPSRLPPQTAAVLIVPPVPVVSAAVPSVTTPATRVTAENTTQTAQTDTAVTGGREHDEPDMVIDTATGEIVYPGADEPDAETRAAMYENYSALHQEEKNIAVHRRGEPDDHDEPGWGNW
ncbi:type IV secretion system DNA-binding domain-containing protein, partial [Morganella morganii]|uniref:type IV secretion system DNA-binding domain-containing protein n=1 Tax=Morganella morganii TaxID=582 RepID=UPI0034E54C91